MMIIVYVLLDGFDLGAGAIHLMVAKTDEERRQVLKAAREASAPSKVLIAGTGIESAIETLRLTEYAAELGYDVALVRTPHFYKRVMQSTNMLAFYRTVADRSPLPVMIYNVPGFTGYDIPAEVVVELAGHSNIIGMKESGGDIAQVADLVSGTPAGFNVLAGAAATFYPALCVGAVGGILALGCAAPDACVRLFELTRAGRHDEAKALQRELVPIARLLGATHGVPGLKAALNLLGYDVGLPRPPLAAVAESVLPLLRDALAPFEEIPA